MNDTVVADFPLRGLEYVFQPPGLPLVDKGNGVGTTSVLVRGGAGTGKTTTAVAIAHAIAVKHGGVCLHLTMEFVPTELRYKAQLLQLAEGLVLHPKRRAEAKPGAILTHHLITHHLARHADTDLPETMDERKRSAIDVIWELVQSEPEDASVPLRSVVIDAFGLSEERHNEPLLRNDLLNLIQALEGKGISTVIVQEATGSADWLSFVVDVVFETSYRADSDTGELHRKLTCPKSRYANTLAGPHDMGLDNGRPSIWPDPLPVVITNSALWLPPSQAVSFFMPVKEGKEFIPFRRGGVLLSCYDKSGIDLLEALWETPGSSHMWVNCGPITNIKSNSPLVRIGVSDTEGAFSIGWAVLRTVLENGFNAVIVQGLVGLLARPRFHIAMLHVIEAWRRAGILVFVHDTSKGLEAVEPLADVVWPAERYRGCRPFQRSWPRLAVSWLLDLSPINSPSPTNPQDIAGAQHLRAELQKALQHIEQSELEAAHEILRKPVLWHTGSAAARIGMEWNIALARLGCSRTLEQRPVTLPSEDPALVAAGAWSLAHTGREGQASQRTFEALSASEPHDATSLLWVALSTIYAENPEGLAELEEEVGTENEKLILGFLLRALAAQGRFKDIDRIADDVGGRRNLPAWHARRIKAEARLVIKKDIDLFKNAVAELKDLLSNDLPRAHKAEVWHNLGLAHELLGDPNEAIKCLRRAREENPFLEVTEDALAALDVESA